MRAVLLSCLVLVLAVPAAARGQNMPPQLVSGPSPLVGRCAANDRTILYGEEPDAEEELSVAVNPADPDNIVVAWNQDLGRGIVAATTHDGGLRWSTTAVPGFTTCTGGRLDRVIHPRLSFAPDGVVYLLGTPLDGFFPDPRSAVADIAVARSHDRGSTWEPARTLNDQPVFNDLGGMTAEPDVAGAAVAVWSHPEIAVDSMIVSRTIDHGQTWQKHEARLPSPANVAGKSVVAHPDGTLMVFVRDDPIDSFFGGPRPQPVSVLRSGDKGRTWSPAVEVVADADAFFWPLTAVDGNGRIHLVWAKQAPDDRLELWLSSSDDTGLTWAPPRPVTTVAAGEEPALTAGADGRMALTFYETADEQGVPMRTAWIATTNDGGASWRQSPLTAPFAETSLEHWVLGPGPLGYATSVAATPTGFRAAFIGSGALAEHGISDVRSVDLR